MNMQDIVVAQTNGVDLRVRTALGNPYILTQFVGFVVFMIAVQAELTQPPFDMPIAESELVVGLHDRVLGLPLPASSSSPSSPRSACSPLIAADAVPRRLGVPFAWFGWTTLDAVDDWMNVVGPLDPVHQDDGARRSSSCGCASASPASVRTSCSASPGRC